MRLLPAARHRRMPWKNGGGETTEIASSPESAGLDAFDWRVSMATVTSDGPFSRFAGIDRTLMVLEGDGLALRVDGRVTARLTPASPPLPFPGDVATQATLLGGPILDLNVMTRRGLFAHRVTPLRLEDRVELGVDGTAVLLVCLTGMAQIETADGPVPLGAFDAVLAEAVAARWCLVAEQPATLVLIEIRAS